MDRHTRMKTCFPVSALGIDLESRLPILHISLAVRCLIPRFNYGP